MSKKFDDDGTLEETLGNLAEAEIKAIMDIAEEVKDENNNCEKNCDDAYEVASAACLLLGNPVKVAACLAIARRAHNECKRHC